MPDPADTALRLFGTVAPPAPARHLRAGPLEARLEDGNLRYIRFDGIEVLRAIAYPVRDRDWGTLRPDIEGLEVAEQADGFRVAYRATCENGGARLFLEARIEGDAAGRLRFAVDARPDRDFETNRCGFTILHPIEGVAGAPVQVEHVDGQVSDTVFPALIAPWQPFKSIRALTHRPAPHLVATCRTSGDVFEMEDQRNWSDASYKTYVRPIEQPWPYILPAGRTVTQSVDLAIVRRGTAPAPPVAGGAVSLHIDPAERSPGRVPKVGLSVAPAELPRALAQAHRLAGIGPQAMLCHLDPTAGHGRDALRGYAALQALYPARYELEYVVAATGDLDAEFGRLREDLQAAGFAPQAVAVCPDVDRGSTPPGSAWPDCPPLEAVYVAARQALPGIELGGGMFSYFTELNRKRPPVALLDFVTHATNPIVHAADDESVMETLEALPHITRSARAIIGGEGDYRLGPTTIGMRQNPYGSRTFDNPDGARLCMAGEDPRQKGLFAAAWTLGYAARIADAGIERWVPAAFAGPRGILAGGDDGLLPVGRVVADLCHVAGATLLPCRTSDPRRLAALAVQDSGKGVTGAGTGMVLLVANLTAGGLRLAWRGGLELAPYEVRCLQVPVKDGHPL